MLAPRIRSLLESHRTVRVLFRIDAGFRGWTMDAAWANTVLDITHRHDFDKVAMVGAPRWEQWCAKVPAAVLMKGRLRTFDRDDLDRAWTWLRQ